jgi:NAD(P)-dependent dehydrogenase (short-subunit alcohol dehydrogenase family)
MSVAVVTGAASGFGLALAERCAALGMAVVLLDRDGDRALTEAHRLAATHGTESMAVGTDVGNRLDVDAAAAVVAERFGVADLVVSNVGVQLFGAVESLTDDEWRWVLDVNVIGAARVARAFLPLLRASARPRLAFTASSSILDPSSRLAACQTSKFAVWGLAESLRCELAGDGIEVSLVLPSGMVSRHLETSEAAQPDHLRRPVVSDDDLTSMMASNPRMASMLTTPEHAAVGVVEAVLAGEPYVVTHGDLTGPVEARAAELTRATRSAARRPSTT